MGRIRDPPKEMWFRYPDRSKRKGMVLRATRPDYLEGKHGNYAVRIELVEWEGGEKAIRFAYYRRPPEKKGDEDWTWGSQTTWTFDREITMRQIELAKSLGFFG